MPSSEERTLTLLIYLLSFPSAILVPLIIWLIKKNESEFINFHGKAYFNFLISYAIYGIIAWILVLVLIGIILLPILGIMAFVFTILAAIKSYNGEHYRIPLSMRFFG
ncbi:DUF4870 domain-containing protein [Oceanobacillus chungangensis]|uniref:DUF4870 domain-containing protein n=1 Tax=Oceanobacillus chungangensis TaxID=1229152 RepID=A0A3D8PMR4_9BACI|nr:DUF4870 domain-containing protein [Oceanobacillus chungangensis]RDW16817.1 DUF4870 domain-containing protein [Oceanobacillus chungangensis]